MKHLSMGWSSISSTTNGIGVARWAIASMAIQKCTLGSSDEKAPARISEKSVSPNCASELQIDDASPRVTRVNRRSPCS